MPNADPNETLARWARYDLERRERKLDMWLRIITIATYSLIGFAITDIVCFRFFFYQQLEHGTYFYSRYDTFTLCRFIMGVAMFKLTYRVSFGNEGPYQHKHHTAVSQLMAALVFFITILINHFTDPSRIDEPRILIIYHWTQTISYISIVVINRLLFALIVKYKKMPYKGVDLRYSKIAVAVFFLITLLETLIARFSFMFPKFFY